MEKEFPGWRVIITDRSNWWAMRGPLPPDRMNERDTVEATSPEKLREALQRLATLAGEEPAAAVRPDVDHLSSGGRS
ncbi:hypothetical protein BJF79_02345 [Actinomadura sp. CNU-125]|nr:hypothetical protein BJF79_02345 [Actinomadura sp. CNU-125]